MKRILLCDDDPVTLNVVGFKLKNEKLGEITNAVDGKEAKTLLIEQTFDLIITDLHMPFHSGLEIASFVRNDQKKNTPIIVLSGEGLENVVLEAFEIGVNDFVTKPFSSAELIIKVKNLLG